MSITLTALQKQRTDTAANWTTANPTLLSGELGFESDTGKMKLGNGSTAWNSLAYLILIPSSGVYPGTQLLMPLGSASAPSLTFNGDPNTGIYSPGADQVALSTGGTGRLFVDANGNVSIGNSNISYSTTSIGIASPSGAGIRLHDSDLGISTTDGLELFVTNGGDGHLWQRENNPITFATNNTERMRLDSSGRLGLGTSSPSYKLHVVDGTVATQSAGGTYNGYFFNTNSSNASARNWGAFSNYANFGDFGLVQSNALGGDPVSAGTTRFYINASGNVGIGTTSPSSPLHVYGGTIRAESTSSSTPGLTLVGAGPDQGWVKFGTTSGDYYSIKAGADYTGMLFIANGSERARIDSSGRLLVGTSSAFTNTSANPYYGKFATVGATNDATAQGIISLGKGAAASSNLNNATLGEIYFTDNAGNPFATIAGWADAATAANDYPGRLVFSTTADGASSPTERMRIDNAGNAFLATAAAGLFVGTTTDGAYRIGQSSFAVSTGTLYIGNAAIQVSSDVRLKKDIEDTHLDALDAISKIKVKDFTWDDPTDTSYNNRNARGKWTGLIAQELVEVLPFVVNAPRREEDGSIDHESDSRWTLDQSQLCPVLIKAIQQQQEIIAGLEARLSVLESV